MCSICIVLGKGCDQSHLAWTAGDAMLSTEAGSSLSGGSECLPVAP